MSKKSLLAITAAFMLVVAAPAQSKGDSHKTAAKTKAKATQKDCCMAESSAKTGDDCCKDMAAKSDPCSDPNGLAKFKVYVVGKGYAYFGCEDMAAKGRETLLKKGEFVGAVQKVAAKVKITSGVKA